MLHELSGTAMVRNIRDPGINVKNTFSLRFRTIAKQPSNLRDFPFAFMPAAFVENDAFIQYTSECVQCVIRTTRVARTEIFTLQ